MPLVVLEGRGSMKVCTEGDAVHFMQSSLDVAAVACKQVWHHWYLAWHVQPALITHKTGC